MLGYAEDYTFLYPPYRPISNTSSFVSYSKESFNYDSQIRPKEFCDKISNYGYSFMLSNSDNKLFGIFWFTILRLLYWTSFGIA